MKLAHLADLHLGFRQFDRQTPKGANQREVDVAEVCKRAVDDMLEQKPELIVVAGDLFHSVRPTNAAILYCFRQLHRLRTGLPGTPIVVIAGEHDTPRSRWRPMRGTPGASSICRRILGVSSRTRPRNARLRKGKRSAPAKGICSWICRARASRFVPLRRRAGISTYNRFRPPG